MSISMIPKRLVNLIAVLTIVLPLMIQAQVVFEQSFEEPDFSVGDQFNTIKGWTGNDKGSDIDVSVASEQASEGAQSIFLSDNSSSERAQVVHDFGENVTQGYFEFDIRPGSAATAYYIHFYSQGTFEPNFYLAISSQFTLGISGSKAKTAAFSGRGYHYDPDASEWHTFRVGFDALTNTAHVSVDGDRIEVLSVDPGDADHTDWQIGRIAIIAGSNAATGVSAHFDHIKLSATGMDSSDEALKSQLDVVSPKINVVDESAYRILFIGNSITRHGFSEETKARLGWGHLAGMAASEADLDYSHRLGQMIQSQVLEMKVALYYHPYGGGGSIAQRLSTLDKVAVCRPDLVVIQLGEHEKIEDGESQIRSDYAALIDGVRAFDSCPKVIAIGPWNTASARDSDGHYLDKTGTIDRIMREVCALKNAPYASTEKISLDRSTFGWGTHRGVQWHPNDAGHARYAEALFNCFQQLNF